jgi:hypothetical protein
MKMEGNPARTLVAAKLCVFLIGSLLLFRCSAAGSDCSAPIVLMNAFDKNLNVERGVRAEDIKVEADGKQVPIVSLLLDAHPRRIVLMLDSSESVRASPQQSGWGLAIAAAGYAAYVVPASASSQLVTFSDAMRRESNDFENAKVVQQKIFDLAKIKPKGRTSLFDSIHQVIAEFKELQFGDAIYIVTDGGDNKSRVSRQKLMRELISRGIRVFVFLVQQGSPQTEEERSGASDMYGFAESTGGAVVRITSDDPAGRKQLDDLAPKITAQVEGVYRLKLGISERKQSFRVKLEFVDRDRKDSTRNIVYSKEIVPCTDEP